MNATAQGSIAHAWCKAAYEVCFGLQSMDLSYNSLSGWVPSSLMGISEPGELDAPELFPDLDTIRVFQQWGSGMCAHVSSSADIPAVPRSLDLGDTSTPSSADILRYMKSQPPPALVASSDACDAKRVSDELLRAAAKQFAAKAEWLLADSDILLTSTPFVMFPSDKDGQAPQEVFIGLCDLPEMLSLAYVPHHSPQRTCLCTHTFHPRALVIQSASVFMDTQESECSAFTV